MQNGTELWKRFGKLSIHFPSLKDELIIVSSWRGLKEENSLEKITENIGNRRHRGIALPFLKPKVCPQSVEFYHSNIYISYNNEPVNSVLCDFLLVFDHGSVGNTAWRVGFLRC